MVTIASDDARGYGRRVSRSVLLIGIALVLGACDRTQSRATPVAVTAAPADAAPPSLEPGERRITVSDGTELYAKIAGRGPVCVFVHGGPGQGSRSFERMGGDALEAFATMVYLDQRGSGLSKEGPDYHLARVTQDLEEVRQALGVEQLCLIAHSFGGILAVDYARRYPARVSRLVLANASLHFRSPAQRRMQIEHVHRVLGRSVVDVPADADRATLDAAHAQAAAALMQAGQGYRFLGEDVEVVRTQARIDAYPRSLAFGAAVVRGLDKLPEYAEDFAPVTASIRVPVLVITSTKDYAVGPDEFRRFRFPDQRVVTLNTGHMSYFEDTAGFAAAIRGFVR